MNQRKLNSKNQVEDFEIEDLDFNLDDDAISDKFIKFENHNISTKDIYYANAEKLAYDIHIQKGECIYVNLEGKFIFGDFIAAFIKVNQLQVEELTVVSLSGSIDNFEMLEGLLDYCGVKKINLMLSKYFLRTEEKKHTKIIKYLNELVETKKGKFKVYYANIHAKVVLIRTKNGFVIIHGSANLRSSQNIEQMIIQENKQLYDFNYKFYKDLI